MLSFSAVEIKVHEPNQAQAKYRKRNAIDPVVDLKPVEFGN